MLDSMLYFLAVFTSMTQAAPNRLLQPRQLNLPQTILTCPPCAAPTYTTSSLASFTVTGVQGQILGATTAVNNGCQPAPTSYSTFTVCSCGPCTVNDKVYGPGTLFYAAPTTIPAGGTITYGGQTLSAPTAVVTIAVNVVVTIDVVIPTPVINNNIVIIGPTNGAGIADLPASLPPLSMTFPTNSVSSISGGAISAGANTANSLPPLSMRFPTGVNSAPDSGASVQAGAIPSRSQGLSLAAGMGSIDARPAGPSSTAALTSSDSSALLALPTTLPTTLPTIALPPILSTLTTSLAIPLTTLPDATLLPTSVDTSILGLTTSVPDIVVPTGI